MTERVFNNTFLGRLRHFIDVIDPSTLFVSEKRLKECIKLLDDYKHGTLPPGVSDLQLWEAQKIKQAIIHPDTGEKIFMPFRMSGTTSDEDLCAVCSSWFIQPPCFSLTLMFSLGRLCTVWNTNCHWPPSPKPDRGVYHYMAVAEPESQRLCELRQPQRNQASFNFQVSPWLCGGSDQCCLHRSGTECADSAGQQAESCDQNDRAEICPLPRPSANICNVGLMRHNELSEGVDVLDDKGNVVGSSKIAARHAIMETAFTRVVLPMPIFVLPPIIMSYFERLRFLQSNRRLLLPIHSAVCLLTFAVSLPVAISLFPQMSQIEVSRLEPEIAMATECKVVTYNKGL
ncbi:sideroflexin-5b isoform X2 [Oryzias melastigma]|uniref:sideroflexin-5b isoform X2 n=1 Tax=Oryzias melastigma TaxID=30732 RepID=UPI000CF807E2|nr:sideroflexin-5b isoform X2 [Oryzias melastigma]